MNTNTQPPAPQKKPYTSPKLTVYGEVRVLTQTTTQGSTEGTPGSGLQKPNSERHFKEHIARIGEHPLGIGIYLFNYKPEFQEAFGRGRQFGVMVDEVESVMPAAIHVNTDGDKTVDLAMLGIYRPMH